MTQSNIFMSIFGINTHEWIQEVYLHLLYIPGNIMHPVRAEQKYFVICSCVLIPEVC
jgi:hypothetical protein